MKVFLRKKPIAGTRSSLFLDFYANGKRHKEYLNLYLENTKQSKIQDRETLRLADNIRAKRQLELENDQHGFGCRNFYRQREIEPS